MNLVVWRSIDGGRLWDYLSVAVNHTQIRGGTTTFGEMVYGFSRLDKPCCDLLPIAAADCSSAWTIEREMSLCNQGRANTTCHC